jgi:hypothetical protein
LYWKQKKAKKMKLHLCHYLTGMLKDDFLAILLQFMSTQLGTALVCFLFTSSLVVLSLSFWWPYFFNARIYRTVGYFITQMWFWFYYLSTVSGRTQHEKLYCQWQNSTWETNLIFALCLLASA